MEKPDLAPVRLQMVQAMEQGISWCEAARRAGLLLSQSTAYRLRQRMRKAGEQALHDGRHGHPTKLRGEVRKFLEEICRRAPYMPSHEIQTYLAERFSLTVSVSQINRVRAALGVSNPPQSAKKKVSIQWSHDTVHVDLCPFNNRQLTRDLLTVCQRVNEMQPRLPDGRILILHASSSPFG